MSQSLRSGEPKAVSKLLTTDMLEERTVDAVVSDSPILAYYLSHDGKGKVSLAGAVFRREDYGIAVPNGSLLRRRVDGALLALREDGTYQMIYERWFGGK